MCEYPPTRWHLLILLHSKDKRFQPLPLLCPLPDMCNFFPLLPVSEGVR
ncbi:mCG147419 [Mus musculus]|nr:mCG147419 [Mus musculus]